MTPLERAARAILGPHFQSEHSDERFAALRERRWQQITKQERDYKLLQARAVIESLMEPSEAMDDAQGAIDALNDFRDERISWREANRRICRSMLRAILKEGWE